jgi:hypothetical protein
MLSILALYRIGWLVGFIRWPLAPSSDMQATTIAIYLFFLETYTYHFIGTIFEPRRRNYPCVWITL